VPWRAKAAEDVIVGTNLDAATIDKAAAATVEGAEPLEQNGYKVPLFEGLMKEQLEAIR
jgi:xanthine dehydrogenase YagS FAD-binding subunit